MKRLTLLMIGLGATAGLVFYLTPSKPATLATDQPVAETTVSHESQPAAAAQANEQQPVKSTTGDSPVTEVTDAPSANPSPAAAPVMAVHSDPAARIAYQQSIETLVNSSSTHAQRQAAWKKLADAGQLDEAIVELERRVAANPPSSQDSGTLGEAYLKKCGQTDDIREKAILAMNADRLFDTALELDPNNWEARYTKAVAMSFWPASLNKGQDVINNFTTLIQQQEALPQQSQFALPYLRLGDQYQAMGNPDNARQVWARGAQFFPGNEDLQNKLAAAR